MCDKACLEKHELALVNSDVKPPAASKHRQLICPTTHCVPSGWMGKWGGVA